MVMIVVVLLLGGFAYAYFNKIDVDNQTKSEIESLGYQVTTNTTNMNFARMNITVAGNLTAFISVVKNVEASCGSPEPIYQQGDSFYIVLPLFQFVGEAVEYTPNNSVWWVV